MKAGIYARISTSDKNQDINLQLVPLREYIERQGWDIYREYLDEGFSGSTIARPGLQDLMRDCRRKLIDTIVIWKLDRLFRSLHHFVELALELQALNIRLVSLTEAIDFGSPQGRLLANLLAVFSEFERDIIRERVREGLKNAVRKGKRLGRKPLEVDLDKLVQLKREGIGIKKIAQAMNVSIGWVHKTLKNLGQETLENQGTKFKQIAIH